MDHDTTEPDFGKIRTPAPPQEACGIRECWDWKEKLTSSRGRPLPSMMPSSSSQYWGNLLAVASTRLSLAAFPSAVLVNACQIYKQL